MSGLHAFLPPSGAEAWQACAFWPTMNSRFPQDDTEDSLNGGAAHWVFEEEFRGQQTAIGQVAPNGVTLTLEMLEGADLYVETIDRDLAQSGLNRGYLNIERLLAIPSIHEANWGTPDTWYFDQARMLLRVYDYKFGHLFVDAFRNWQCVNYVAGIVDLIAAHLGMQPAELDQILKVEIVVVQPRNYDGGNPVRRWPCMASDLRGMHNQLQAAAARAVRPDAAATPGPQCDYCPGRHACTALQREGYRAKHLSLQSVPVELDAATLAYELRMLTDAEDLLKARKEGLREQAFARLKRGERIPGYCLEPTYGRQDWNIPPEEVIAMGQLVGLKLAKPKTLTPKQAIDAGMSEELVAMYSGAPGRGLSLKRDDGTAAAKAFSNK